MSDLPLFYTSLRDFRAVFSTGLPILTYHKLGPRPRGVRMKGLYVSRRVFERQLKEWTRDGWRSVGLDTATATSPAGKSLILTFDDGFENVFRHGLEPLSQHGFKAIQYLVADRLGGQNDWEQKLLGEAPERLMDVGQVREWLAAGHEIGAHTCTHPQLTRIKADEAREEIAGCRRKLEDLFGRPVKHFCYPYGDWDAAVRELVAEAGFETASTVEPGINSATTDRLALKRFTARYRSRNWKSVWANFRDMLGAS